MMKEDVSQNVFDSIIDEKREEINWYDHFFDLIPLRYKYKNI